MSVRILQGLERAETVAADDRGLNYGDGVFETILVHEGCLVWWREHWRRLVHGADALAIPMPDEERVRREAEELIGRESRAVLKIVLTRGIGGRGYATVENPVPTVVLSRHAAPPIQHEPIALRWCRTPLAIQPVLAGIKHLNRLEQVLARAEWRDPAVFEGLMRDREGRVVCATAANLFARIRGRWWTPPVRRCGVAGLTRAWLLERLKDADEAELGVEDVLGAEALFLCNAVRGILPVERLDDKRWPAHAESASLRLRLAEAEPAFAI